MNQAGNTPREEDPVQPAPDSAGDAKPISIGENRKGHKLLKYTTSVPDGGTFMIVEYPELHGRSTRTMNIENFLAGRGAIALGLPANDLQAHSRKKHKNALNKVPEIKTEARGVAPGYESSSQFLKMFTEEQPKFNEKYCCTENLYELYKWIILRYPWYYCDLYKFKKKGSIMWKKGAVRRCGRTSELLGQLKRSSECDMHLIPGNNQEELKTIMAKDGFHPAMCCTRGFLDFVEKDLQLDYPRRKKRGDGAQQS